jgi:hypothetical protein
MCIRKTYVRTHDTFIHVHDTHVHIHGMFVRRYDTYIRIHNTYMYIWNNIHTRTCLSIRRHYAYVHTNRHERHIYELLLLVWICTHTRHVHTHVTCAQTTHACTYVHACTYIHMHSRTWHICTCLHTHKYTWHTHICVCICNIHVHIHEICTHHIHYTYVRMIMTAIHMTQAYTCTYYTCTQTHTFVKCAYTWQIYAQTCHIRAYRQNLCTYACKSHIIYVYIYIYIYIYTATHMSCMHTHTTYVHKHEKGFCARILMHSYVHTHDNIKTWVLMFSYWRRIFSYWSSHVFIYWIDCLDLMVAAYLDKVFMLHWYFRLNTMQKKKWD